jgi:hypothetical protein
MADTPWTLIATAPTDGRDVLVGFAPGGRQLVARYNPEQGGWTADDQQLVSPTPTHWQPLGDPPPAEAPAPAPEPPAPDAPVVTSLDPTTAALGAPSFTLHVYGTGFTPDAVILWNGSAEPTTVVSETEVTTGVAMETAEVAMAIPVGVQNAGGPPSNTLTFLLTDLVLPVPHRGRPRR